MCTVQWPDLADKATPPRPRSESVDALWTLSPSSAKRARNGRNIGLTTTGCVPWCVRGEHTYSGISCGALRLE
eukprot:scaffold128999_cov63-Phaeocystis_antarctica.AAC.1